MPIPLPGRRLRTMARARTCPLGKSKIKSRLEPAEAGCAGWRKRAPSAITSAREVQVCLADFQPTHMPLGARTRGYLRGILGSGDMLRAGGLPYGKFIRCESGNDEFRRRCASMSNLTEALPALEHWRLTARKRPPTMPAPRGECKWITSGTDYRLRRWWPWE